MLRYPSLAVLVVAVASCGEGYEGDGSDEDKDIEQVSSAVTFNGHDYLFFHQLATWDSAKAIACKGPWYHLAQINSAEENEFIRAEAVRQGGGNWWIGYNDKSTEGLWVWSGGDAPGYVNWGSGEPNNWNNEDCAWMDSNTGKWNDAPCASGSYLTSFVCERASVSVWSDNSFPYNASNTASATQNVVQRAVNLTRNQKITVGTCGMVGADNDGDTFLRFKSPFGSELTFNDNACGSGPTSGPSNFSYVVPNTGTYYIWAGCSGSKTCWGSVAYQVVALESLR